MHKPVIHIRMAFKNDAELIADLSRQTFIETFSAHNTVENMDKFLNGPFSKDNLIKEVGLPGNSFFLVYEDDSPVGYMKMRESNNPAELAGVNAIEIARIYAVRSSIGKGIGKRMMEECIHVANEKKKELIWLGVWENNTRAIDFYSNWGFERFSSHVFKLGDDSQTDWLMKKNTLMK